METIEQFKKEIDEHAKKKGWIVNPTFNWKKFQNIKEAEGDYYCPCRPIDSERCPCKDHERDVNAKGHCYCNLFQKPKKLT